MSQIPTENEDNRSVAYSDFVQLDQPDEVQDQHEAQQQQEQPQNTGSARNYDNELKEHKWMIANLEAKNQTLQYKVEILELKAENRALKENAEQKAKDQALETKCANLLSTQNERHKIEVEQLESKNRKLEEKLSELQTKGTTENALEGKMEQLKNEFAAMLSDKMATLQREMDESGKRAIDGNQLKLDYIWGQLMIKGNKIFANPKGNVFNALKTRAKISESGLKATGDGTWQYVFAKEGYATIGEQCRKDNFRFPGTIVFYYEVAIITASAGYAVYWFDSAGFSDGNAGHYASTNSYAIKKTDGAVVGSGLLLNSKNELAVFFTFNGQLLGNPIPINPAVDRLYPTFNIHNISVEINFGDNRVDKPFKFDIDKCPGLVFDK